MYTNKIYRDNHIHYTSLCLLFSTIMHAPIDVDLFVLAILYPLSILDLHVGENLSLPLMAQDSQF